MRAVWLWVLAGCAGGADLERALTGTGSDDPILVLAPDGAIDARILLDAGAADATPAGDLGPVPPDVGVLDARPRDASPPDATPPDAGGCDPREGQACVVTLGACRNRGRLVCVDDALICTAEAPMPTPEQCDGQDNDCDGQTDEGVANACGQCGLPPDEVCNGFDDDCNGVVDEGLQNACGGCGPLLEVCDGVDQDCDGQVDERACRAWVLPAGRNRWVAPPGLNAPLADGRVVDAAATFFTDSAEIWLFVGQRILIYRLDEDRYVADLPLGILPGVEAPVETAEAVPLWWRLRNDPLAVRSSLVLTRGDEVRTLDVDPFAQVADGVDANPILDAWIDDPNAPRAPLALQASVLDLRNARGFWQGNPRTVCQGGDPTLGPTLGVLNRDRLHMQDVGICNLFVESHPAGAWPGFDLAGAPDPGAISAWTHVEPELPGQGTEVIFIY